MQETIRTLPGPPAARPAGPADCHALVLSATAWFCDADGWVLAASFRHQPWHSLGAGRGASYRGDMAPLELITRCQGTLALLNGASGSLGKCLRHTPTWRGLWAGVCTYMHVRACSREVRVSRYT